MTVGVIGLFSDYANLGADKYFKARLIKDKTFMGSPHEIEELNNELYKGVYI
jgi:hypothetical protein